MDSGIIVDASDDVNWKGKSRWTENSLVYTRRTHKKARKTLSNNGTNNGTATTTTESASTATTTTAAENPTSTPAPTKVPSPAVASAPAAEASTASTSTSGDDVVPQSLEVLAAKNTNETTAGEQQSPSQTDVRNLRNDASRSSDDVAQISIEPSPLLTENGLTNGPTNVSNGSAEPLVVSKVDDKVRFKLAKATQKDEIKFLREKFVTELDQVSKLVNQLDQAKLLHLASYNSQVRNSNLSNNNNNNNSSSRVFVRVNSDTTGPTILARANSDVGSAREPRAYNRQLSVAVMENSYVEKEKRTPKANQYYRNSEFLLGKDRLPPENVKRSKTSKGRKHGFGFGFNKSCSSLLQRLMKHKHGWVFNNPVDVNVLGLVDYHDIIKNPMDLGTIKTNLSKNRYKSPIEFAEDVRLVFRNAMTYNPKGHEVHAMAEELFQLFEDRWATMESEYNNKKATHQSHFTVPVPLFAPASAHLRTASTMSVDPKVQRPHGGRTPVPKKPKARDENKRDMTYDEKQRLSANLQNLPLEKLDAVVQIIKRRNTELSQNDDEIEVDIDNVDTETLWELDRFVTNYKKSLSKNKRKAELAIQAREAAKQTVALANTNPVVTNGQIDSGTATGEKNVPPADEGANNGISSSSSSSSSDSGSSSSDSDSDSSSANGSDAGHSPGS